MSSTGPIRLASPSGVAVQVNANGSIRRIDFRDVIVNAFLGNELEGGPANLYLRRRGARIDWIPLLGPRSPGAVRLDADGLEVAGDWNGLRFRASLALASSAPAWFWHVALANEGDEPATIDLIYAQDLALADYGAVRLNEYYVSQYVDYTPLDHPARGTMLAVRQNLAVGGRHPWLALGSLGRARELRHRRAPAPRACDARAASRRSAYAADRLPGVRRQHEHSMAVLQDAAGEARARRARGVRLLRLARAGSPGPVQPRADLALRRGARSRCPRRHRPRSARPPSPSRAPRRSSATRPLLAAAPLDEAALAAHFGRRAPRRRVRGWRAALLLRSRRRARRAAGEGARELAAARADPAHRRPPRARRGVAHDDGVDGRRLPLDGHAGPRQHQSLPLDDAQLPRPVPLARPAASSSSATDGWQLLDVPSAFEMTPSGARWLYARGRTLEVRSWASVDRPRAAGSTVACWTARRAAFSCRTTWR